MSVTTAMREYLGCIAESFATDPDGAEQATIDTQKERLWGGMTADEREYLNGLVEDIFGPWL